MPRFSTTLAATLIAFAAASSANALPLHPSPTAAEAGDASAAVQQVRHRGHHGFRSGTYFTFGFGAPFFHSYGFGPRVYSYDPYYYGYYEPYYAPRTYEPRYYEPAPAYEPAPYYRSDPTGQCSDGLIYRYPVGCVPY